MGKKGLRLHAQDNCVVLLEDVHAGECVDYEGGAVVASGDADLGHKLAIMRIPVGSKVYKYGASIGSATVPIEPGEHIHTHNMTSDYIVGFHR